jgi:hypothetical protein
MEVPQKTKNKLTYNPSTPLLGIYLKECKAVCKRDTCEPMVTAAVFITAKL